MLCKSSQVTCQVLCVDSCLWRLGSGWGFRAAMFSSLEFLQLMSPWREGKKNRLDPLAREKARKLKIK